MNKIKLWIKQLACNHILQANNIFGWECLLCEKKATKWTHVYFTRWNGESKKEYKERIWVKQ